MSFAASYQNVQPTVVNRKKPLLTYCNSDNESGYGSDSDSDFESNSVKIKSRLIPSNGKCALDLIRAPPGKCCCEKCRYNDRILRINKYIKRQKPLNPTYNPEKVIEELRALGRNVYLTKNNIIIERKKRKKRDEVRDLQNYTNNILERKKRRMK